MLRIAGQLLLICLLAGCGPLVSDPDAVANPAGPPAPGVDARNRSVKLPRRPVEAGDEVPYLVLSDQLGNEVTTVELTTSQDAVMVFLPALDSPAARPVLQWVRRNRDLIRQRGAEVVLVTPAPSELNAPVTQAEGLHVAVLSDPAGWAARSFGLAAKNTTRGVDRPWTVVAGREGRVLAAEPGLMDATDVIQALAVRPAGDKNRVIDFFR